MTIGCYEFVDEHNLHQCQYFLVIGQLMYGYNVVVFGHGDMVFGFWLQGVHSLLEPETMCVHDHETNTPSIQDASPHRNDVHTNV